MPTIDDIAPALFEALDGTYFVYFWTKSLRKLVFDDPVFKFYSRIDCRLTYCDGTISELHVCPAFL